MGRQFTQVAIVHHTYTHRSLIEEELLKYLQNRAATIFYLTHPFKSARDGVSPHSIVRCFNRGQETARIVGPRGYGNALLYYLRDFVYTIYVLWRQPGSIDLYVGVDNLNALAGILLKKIGKVKKVIYYVIDYVPLRFENRFLNWLYHWLDFFAVRNADQTWNLSEAMTEVREAKGLASMYRKKQITVPVGTNLLDAAQRQPYQLVFLGILDEAQGVDKLIEAMPTVLKQQSRARLLVIGSGPMYDHLRTRIHELSLERIVRLTGYVKDNKVVERYLSESTLGLAPYLMGRMSFKPFTDPGKIKTYLGAGLPVIMTPISPIAEVLEKAKAGFIIDDSVSSLTQTISNLLDEPKKILKAQQSAALLAKRFEWSTVFDAAIAKLPL